MVINSKFQDEFMAVMNSDKIFQVITAYFLLADVPSLKELEKSVSLSLKNDFKFWQFVINKAGLNDIAYNNLVGYFKYFGIADMEFFLHNKNGQLLFQILKENETDIRIYFDEEAKKYTTVKFTCSYTKVYFYYPNGLYNCYDLNYFRNRCNVLNNILLGIKKIEKNINDEWIPILANINDKFFMLIEIDKK